MVDALSEWSRVFVAFVLASCAGLESDPLPLTAETPLLLEKHITAVIIEAASVPGDVPEAIEWRFDEPQPEWKPIGFAEAGSLPVRLEQLVALELLSSAR